MGLGSAENWRKLRFESIDDCMAEVHRIMEADRSGRLRAMGNWTPGQVLSHVAAWIEYAYEGFPVKPAPFFVRWIIRLRRKRILEHGMPHGVRIPGLKEGTTGMDDVPVQQAAQRLLAALQRLGSTESANYDSPAFGYLSDADRIRLNLRHAELHLGYLTYDAISLGSHTVQSPSGP